MKFHDKSLSTMKNTLHAFLAIALLAFTTQSIAQLSPGSYPPNWTLTDIEGNVHTLYDYLNQGKTVVLDFSATWCGPCWNYHNTGALETFWEEHGPDGTDESLVFFIEGDLSTNMDDLLGLTPQSQGNWVGTTPYPIIDLQSSAVMNAYNINYYPTLYKICPDYTVYEVGQVPAATWGNWIQSCTLDADLNATQGTTCYGLGQGSASLDVSGGYGNITYHWSNGDNTPELQNAEAGTYYVTVTDQNGRHLYVNDIELTGPLTAIEVTSSEVQNLMCFGDGSGIIQIAASGGNNGISYLWNTGSSSPIISGLAAGLYTVTVTDAMDCDLVESYEVEEPTVLQAGVETAEDHCQQNHGFIEVDPDGGTAPYTIESSGGNLFPGSMTVMNLGEGTYTIEVTDAHNCVFTQEVSIENIEGPDLTMPASPTVTCLSGPVAIEAFVINPGGGDLEYSWTTPNGQIISGEYDLTCIVNAPGMYTLSIEDIDYGCDVQASIQVLGDVNAPEVEAGPDLLLDCTVQTVIGSVESSLSENFTIQWTTTGGHIVSGANTANPVFDAAGVYTVTVVNLLNGCSGKDEITITDESIDPDAGFSVVADELVATFSANQEGALTYHWDFGDGQTADIASPVHTYTVAGVYHVCLTVTNACGSSMNCFDVLVQSAAAVIQIEIEISNISCYGMADGSLVANAAGGSGVYTYSWVSPSGEIVTGSSLSDLPPGTYLLTVSDDMGNVSQVQVTITEPSVIEGQVQVTPPGNNGPSIDLTINGGTQGYTYLWSNGATTQDLIFLSTGTYQCTVTDANGCEYVTEPIRIINPRDLYILRPGSQVQVHGVPGNQPLVIDIDAVADNAKYTAYVFDALGQPITNNTWVGSRGEVNISAYPSGIYVLAVYEGNTLLKSIRLVVAH